MKLWLASQPDLLRVGGRERSVNLDPALRSAPGVRQCLEIIPIAEFRFKGLDDGLYFCLPNRMPMPH